MTREVFEVEAPYKFTMPLEKAEQRADGYYLVGLASGPEVDSQNERVHPSLIMKWADQINSGQITVKYRDWHQKDTSLEDLGDITKAWVDENNHLGVEVKLDEDHPTAMFIYKKAKAGKQFGMSVFGKVISFADEFDQALQRKVRTFYDATLDEVSNTTRPVWTPSFGTVLAKAVTEAANGDNRLGDEVKVSEATVSETTTTETTDSGAATAPDTGKAPEEAAVETTKVETAETTEVEKAIKTDTKKDAKLLEGIVNTYNTLGQKLQAAGLLSVEDEGEKVATAEETTVTKSETTESTEATSAPDVATLSKAVSDLTGIVAALADRIPDGSAPGVLRKADAVDPMAELAAIEDPIERLRLGLAAAHGQDIQR